MFKFYCLKSSPSNCNPSFPSVLSTLPMLGPLSYLQAHQPPRSFNWRRGRDMLFGTSGIHAVVLNGKVYIGGGYAGSDKDKFIIQVYTPESDGWRGLPECPVRRFAIAVLNQQLVLVGGVSGYSIQSTILVLVGGFSRGYGESTVLVWDSTSQRWTTPYPNMPTARYSPAAIGYQQFLVVASGSVGRSSLKTVEILNSSTKQWSTASSLPIGCFGLTPALVGDTLYLLGGWSEQSDSSRSSNKQMFSISLPALISHATSTSRAPPPTWEVTDTDHPHSTAVSLHNSLLAVGGKDEQDRRSSAIRLYNPQTRLWAKVGDVPAALSRCSCTVLSSGELLVLGGDGEGGRYISKLYIAKVN